MAAIRDNSGQRTAVPSVCDLHCAPKRGVGPADFGFLPSLVDTGAAQVVVPLAGQAGSKLLDGIRRLADGIQVGAKLALEDVSQELFLVLVSRRPSDRQLVAALLGWVDQGIPLQLDVGSDAGHDIPDIANSGGVRRHTAKVSHLLHCLQLLNRSLCGVDSCLDDLADGSVLVALVKGVVVFNVREGRWKIGQSLGDVRRGCKIYRRFPVLCVSLVYHSGQKPGGLAANQIGNSLLLLFGHGLDQGGITGILEQLVLDRVEQSPIQRLIGYVLEIFRKLRDVGLKLGDNRLHGFGKRLFGRGLQRIGLLLVFNLGPGLENLTLVVGILAEP